MSQIEIEKQLSNTLTALKRQMQFMIDIDTLDQKDKRQLATSLYQLEMWTTKAIRELVQTYTERE